MGKNVYYLYSKENDMFVGMKDNFDLTLVNDMRKAKPFRKKQAAKVFQNNINNNCERNVKVTIILKHV